MDFSSCSHLSALTQQILALPQDLQSLAEHKCGLVSMVSKANQPFLISLSDTNWTQNPLEIQGGGINWDNSVSLYLDPRWQTSSIKHLPCDSEIRWLPPRLNSPFQHEIEWAARCNCPCLVCETVSIPTEKRQQASFICLAMKLVLRTYSKVIERWITFCTSTTQWHWFCGGNIFSAPLC